MKDAYMSVRQCLSDWEFCPLCGKRTNVDINANTVDSISYITEIDNKEIRVKSKENIVYIIRLQDNSIIYNSLLLNPYLRICCKNFHWGIIYDISKPPQKLLNLTLNKLSFFIKDKKKNISYNIISNHLNNETIVQISNETSIIQELRQTFTVFNLFDKKHLIKKIRALCLLT